MSDEFNNPIGTLSIVMFLVMPETPYRGERCKRVTLARIHGVRRDECDELRDGFMKVNPALSGREVMAEWSCREII